MKLNLGCGKDQRKGYIGLDIKDYGQEIVRDAQKGLPFQDETLDEIFTKHSLEHFQDIRFVLDECYRCLKKGGLLNIVVPHKKGSHDWNIYHYWHFNEFTVKHIADEYNFKIKELFTNDRPEVYGKLIK